MDTIQLIPQAIPSAPSPSGLGGLGVAGSSAATAARGAAFLSMLEQVDQAGSAATPTAAPASAAQGVSNIPATAVLTQTQPTATTTLSTPTAMPTVGGKEPAASAPSNPALQAPVAPVQAPDSGAILLATLQFQSDSNNKNSNAAATTETVAIETTSAQTQLTTQKTDPQTTQSKGTDDKEKSTDKTDAWTADTWTEGAAMAFATTAQTMLTQQPIPVQAPVQEESNSQKKSSDSHVEVASNTDMTGPSLAVESTPVMNIKAATPAIPAIPASDSKQSFQDTVSNSMQATPAIPASKPFVQDSIFNSQQATNTTTPAVNANAESMASILSQMKPVAQAQESTASPAPEDNIQIKINNSASTAQSTPSAKPVVTDKTTVVSETPPAVHDFVQTTVSAPAAKPAEAAVTTIPQNNTQTKVSENASTAKSAPAEKPAEAAVMPKAAAPVSAPREKTPMTGEKTPLTGLNFVRTRAPANNSQSKEVSNNAVAAKSVPLTQVAVASTFITETSTTGATTADAISTSTPLIVEAAKTSISESNFAQATKPLEQMGVGSKLKTEIASTFEQTPLQQIPQLMATQQVVTQQVLQQAAAQQSVETASPSIANVASIVGSNLSSIKALSPHIASDIASELDTNASAAAPVTVPSTDGYGETAQFESIRRDLDRAYGQSSENIQNFAQYSSLRTDESSVTVAKGAPSFAAPSRQDLHNLAGVTSHSPELFAGSVLTSDSTTDSSRGASGISSEKSGNTSSSTAPSQIREILDLLPKPLRPTNIEIRTETLGTIRIKVTQMQGANANSWKIEIRASDPVAQSLLSQNAGELRQHLQADSVSLQGSTLSLTTTQAAAPRDDSGAQQRQGRSQQAYEPDQQQNNRRKQEWFDLPEASGNNAPSRNGSNGTGVKRS